MATKEEYEEALESMQSIYCDLDNSISAGAKFNNGVHLLYELITEHFEEKVESNLEHYYDDLLKVGCCTFGVTDGKIKNCNRTACSQCEIRALDEKEYCRTNAIKWLASSYKKPTYKLTQLEYDLLNAYKNSGMRLCISNYSTLLELYEKGYFKDIGTSIPIHKILDNCEVIK